MGGINQNILRIESLINGFNKNIFLDESPLDEWNQKTYNIRSISLLKYFKIIKSCDIVHIHTPVWWLRCMHILASKILRRRIVVTIHSWKNFRKLSADFMTTKFCLQFADKVIYVNKEYDCFFNLKKSSTYYMPAFIPDISKKRNNMPEKLKNLFEKKRKIISANAYRLDLINNMDLYGLDICLETARLFKENAENFTIIFIVASLRGKSNQIYLKYSDIVKKEKLEDYILIYPKAIDFLALIELSDIVIRPTLTDGDALTIREALYKRVPVIASDAIQRPKGTIIFKNRNSSDLYSKIKGVLSGNIKLEKHDMPSYEFYLDFYRRLYNIK
jgi:glycosyltransferase involved in cell wall biosynthesis